MRCGGTLGVAPAELAGEKGGISCNTTPTTFLLLLVGIILIDAVGFLVADIVINWVSIIFIFTNIISLIVYFINPGIKILRNIK